MLSCPAAVIGKCVMISTVHSSQQYSGVDKGCSKPYGFYVLTFAA